MKIPIAITQTTGKPTVGIKLAKKLKISMLFPSIPVKRK
jgi:hypothetical protein